MSKDLSYKPEAWFVYILRAAYARSQWYKCAKRFDRFFERLVEKNMAEFRSRVGHLCSSPGCNRAAKLVSQGTTSLTGRIFRFYLCAEHREKASDYMGHYVAILDYIPDKELLKIPLIQKR